MNLAEENEVSVEENDDYELLGITWGKYFQKSFVFHVKHRGRYFEFWGHFMSDSRTLKIWKYCIGGALLPIDQERTWCSGTLKI